MDENEKDLNSQGQPEKQSGPAGRRYIKIKPFVLLMMAFGLILATAGVTFFALTVGDDKVVEVVSPQTDRSQFKKLFDAYDAVKKEYYEKVTDEELVNGAINGMIESLGDPYSDYLDEVEAGHLNESISSSFEGIGAEIQERNGHITIVSPIKNSPAEKAHLQPDDIILEADGKSLQGMSSSEAVLLIRGEKGTSVKLKIQRAGLEEPIDVTVVRDVIPIETVYAEMLDDEVAHIQISSFSENTYKELLAAIEDMEKDGMKGMVVDVRQNPGGLLNSAIDISNLFVEEGKPLFQIENKGEKPEIYYAKDGRKIKIPVVLMIDGGSASASEILAGAMKESAGIKSVGEHSFGKGTVQTPQQFKDGSNLKLTTAKWLTPDGNWIHEKGFEPDFPVAQPEYAKLPYINPETSMKEGTTSMTVLAAEEMLEAVGYDPGEADGVFDEHTENAVKALQKDEDLKVDGVLEGDTTYALMDKLREKIKTDDPQLKKAAELVHGQLK
ncbi:lmo1851 family serine protease [Edaphobacillus lindanitolerans]|uniref:Carboxyl-terminal processing protease n=1 Tax=Edaphobacillus lindanitolerans TaxID=550447 RepID=A0A1U7PJ78_9BACI|nr:S41 family peptidase [Edaphobacillus lindanitolerans]SIT80635.1 carboxyl-terminal processing protease [Edaphobacillus lindanitolerans]